MAPDEPVVRRGVCHALLAFEVAAHIDLDRAQRHITALQERPTIRHKRRAPRYFDYRPPPLRVIQDDAPLAIGPYRTGGNVDLVLYDFGAVSVTHAIPFAGSLTELIALSEALYDDTTLLADSRRRIEGLLDQIARTLTRTRIADVVETYFIFQIEELERPYPPDVLAGAYGRQIAQLLRSERTPLSDQEVQDALAYRISFSADDLAVLDWDAALLVDRDADDVRAVLEFANVELLEMRYLDQKLDDALDESYEVLTRRRTRRRLMSGSSRADLDRVGQLQVDGAVLFEGVNNALKLVGDQYLARVYRLVSQRFHLAEWDASILRKLQTLESIYQKVADQSATRRMEVLEWIVILLIGIEVFLSIFGRLSTH